jgi:hypothetical protein
MEVNDSARPFEAKGQTARQKGRKKDWAIKGRAAGCREFIKIKGVVLLLVAERE